MDVSTRTAAVWGGAADWPCLCMGDIMSTSAGYVRY